MSRSISTPKASRSRRVLARGSAFAALVVLLVQAAAPSQAVSAGNWPAYQFGPQHPNVNPNAVAITPANASNLTEVWHFFPDPPTEPHQSTATWLASPTVYDGVVYIGANTGVFYALDEATGAVIWQRQLGWQPHKTCAARGIASTAAVAPDPTTGLPTVYVGSGSGYLYALNAADGTDVWPPAVVALPSATANDYYIWSSPLVVAGHIYVGLSSECDVPLIRGGLVQFSQATGATEGTYYTVPEGNVGASIWSSPAATDNGKWVWITVGQAKKGTPQGDAKSIVRLDPATMTAVDRWTIPDKPRIPDPDFGSTPQLFSADLKGTGKLVRMIGACHKNGLYYGWKRMNLHHGPVWSTQVGAPSNTDVANGPKCLTSAINGGSVLYVAANASLVNGVDYPGSIRALDAATGNLIWATGLPSSVAGTPTMDGAGVIAVATWNFSSDPTADLPDGAYLIDASTGQILNSIDTNDSRTFAQPVFADQYLFIASETNGLRVYTPAAVG